MERLKPAKLDLPFKEVPFIFIGNCGSEEQEHRGNFGPLGGAHTHLCPNDPYRRVICISDKDCIRPELMWHEYAHVLTRQPYIVEDCGLSDNDHKVKFNTEKDLREWDEGHNPEWKKILEGFGFPTRKYIPWG